MTPPPPPPPPPPLKHVQTWSNKKLQEKVWILGKKLFFLVRMASLIYRPPHTFPYGPWGLVWGLGAREVLVWQHLLGCVRPLGVTFYWRGLETSSWRCSSLKCLNKNWNFCLLLFSAIFLKLLYSINQKISCSGITKPAWTFIAAEAAQRIGQVTKDAWQMTGNMWHMTHDMWHMTHSTWHMAQDT